MATCAWRAPAWRNTARAWRRQAANHAPTLSFDGSPTRTRTLAANGAPYVTNVFQAELQASYEIDVWGRLGKLSEAAGESFRAEQASVDAAALSIAASVATAYLNLRGLDAQLALTQATLALRVQSRELARKQFEVGYSSQLEWQQAQSEYHAAAELVPQLQRQIFEQENALALLVGGNPGPIARGLPLQDLTRAFGAWPACRRNCCAAARTSRAPSITWRPPTPAWPPRATSCCRRSG